MEINRERLNKKPKYLALSTAAILVTAFVLVQPTMQTANAVTAEDLSQWDNCQLASQVGGLGNIFGDLIEQNSVKKGDIVKTIHAEKEIFICFLNQGNLPVVIEVTTYTELFENVTAKKVIGSNALVVSCLKDSIGSNGFPSGSAVVLGCVNYIPSHDVTFVGSDCAGLNVVGIPVSPMGMDTQRVGKIVKTTETQKQIYICELPDGTIKKVDIVLFTEIYEDISTRAILSVQNHQMRCVVLVTDNSEDLRDGTVESCIFSDVNTQSESGIPSK